MEMFSEKRGGRPDWMPFSSEEFDIMSLKFALVFVELKNWPMAVYASQHVSNVDGTTRRGWKPPRLSDFHSPVEFAEYAKEHLMIGLARLSLPPDFLISPGRVRELRRDFIKWLQSASGSAWPQFDLSNINLESLVTDVDVTQLPDHPSSLQLNELLTQYLAYIW